MAVPHKANPVPPKDGSGGSQRDGGMMKRPKVELVPVEADSDTQRVLESLIEALEKQGFKIIRKEK